MRTDPELLGRIESLKKIETELSKPGVPDTLNKSILRAQIRVLLVVLGEEKDWNIVGDVMSKRYGE